MNLSTRHTSAQDYYPFGSLEPGRTYSLDNYRFGFNGKEMDNEINGSGAQYDYGIRIYDSRLGKFISVDPLSSSYPWYSPYQFTGNKPIIAIDVDRLEEKLMIDDNTYEIRATYVAEQKVLDNIDVVLCQNLINEYLNANETNLIQNFEIKYQYPSMMSNDCQPDMKEKQTTVRFSITIATTPLNADDINTADISKSRIYTKNGQSLGGKILMGTPEDKGFIAKDKDGLPIANGVVFAYYTANTIVLNPVYFNQSYSGYEGFEYVDASNSGVLSHEIGHDLGLSHPNGEYPETGTMSTDGGTPTLDEINTIIDDTNSRIIQEGEKYE